MSDNFKNYHSEARYNRQRPQDWSFNQTCPHRTFYDITLEDRENAVQKVTDAMNEAAEKIGEFSQLT